MFLHIKGDTQAWASGYGLKINYLKLQSLLCREGKPGRDKEELHDMSRTVKQVMRDTEMGMPVDKVAEKRHISRELAEQICRLYLTQSGVDAEGIMRKMGIS